MQICQSKVHIGDFLFDGISNVCHICGYLQDIPVFMVQMWPLEQAEVKDKYANWVYNIIKLIIWLQQQCLFYLST